jgi:hypothetical protein
MKSTLLINAPLYRHLVPDWRYLYKKCNYQINKYIKQAETSVFVTPSEQLPVHYGTAK